MKAFFNEKGEKKKNTVYQFVPERLIYFATTATTKKQLC